MFDVILHKELEIERQFDPQRHRHYFNGEMTVLHSHHAAVHYTRLTLTAGETGLFAEVAEETFYEILQAYFRTNAVDSIEERIEIGCRQFAAFGLGCMQVRGMGEDSGEVVLSRSHIDEGWLEKWGRCDEPVNYLAAGYIAALFAAVQNRPAGTFAAREETGIVMGADHSTFVVFRK